MMLKILPVAVLMMLLTGNGWSRTYNTSFPATENPICQGSPCIWVGEQSAGSNLWGNVQTTPGFAYGVSQPTGFGDPTALLTGTWGPNQTVSVTVRVTANITGCCAEAEVRLRSTISPSRITGYEVYCSVAASGADYCNIARWNGPEGDYCNIESSSPAVHLVTGDILTGKVTGTNPVLITGTVTRSGSVVATVSASDSGASCSTGLAAGPFVSGNPGIGFYAYGGAASAYFIGWGFTSFTATDGIASTVPNAPTGLTVTVH